MGACTAKLKVANYSLILLSFLQFGTQHENKYKIIKSLKVYMGVWTLPWDGKKQKNDSVWIYNPLHTCEHLRDSQVKLQVKVIYNNVYNAITDIFICFFRVCLYPAASGWCLACSLDLLALQMFVLMPGEKRSRRIIKHLFQLWKLLRCQKEKKNQKTNLMEKWVLENPRLSESSRQQTHAWSKWKAKRLLEHVNKK